MSIPSTLLREAADLLDEAKDCIYLPSVKNRKLCALEKAKLAIEMMEKEQ